MSPPHSGSRRSALRAIKIYLFLFFCLALVTLLWDICVSYFLFLQYSTVAAKPKNEERQTNLGGFLYWRRRRRGHTISFHLSSSYSLFALASSSPLLVFDQVQLQYNTIQYIRVLVQVLPASRQGRNGNTHSQFVPYCTLYGSCSCSVLPISKGSMNMRLNCQHGFAYLKKIIEIFSHSSCLFSFKKYFYPSFVSCSIHVQCVSFNH